MRIEKAFKPIYELLSKLEDNIHLERDIMGLKIESVYYFEFRNSIMKEKYSFKRVKELFGNLMKEEKKRWIIGEVFKEQYSTFESIYELISNLDIILRRQYRETYVYELKRAKLKINVKNRNILLENRKELIKQHVEEKQAIIKTIESSLNEIKKEFKTSTKIYENYRKNHSLKHAV